MGNKIAVFSPKVLNPDAQDYTEEEWAEAFEEARKIEIRDAMEEVLKNERDSKEANC